MTNPIHATWGHAKAHSPLLHAWRWAARQAHRQALASEIINNADLPASIGARIDTITRGTRLWPTERAEIARELVVHARDALDAERDTDDILTTLGDPKAVSKLLRRAARRKRSWLWQVRRWTSNAVLCALGVMTVSYAALFIRFNSGLPDIDRHYIAELNQRNAGYAEEQHAWPAVEALWVEWMRESRRLSAVEDARRDALIESGADPFEQPETRPERAFAKWWNATPDHAGYTEYRAFLDRIEPQIESASRAAHLPTFGGLYSDRTEDVPIEGASFSVTRAIPASTRADETGSLITVLLPWIGQTRKAGKVLLTDAFFASESGDAQRTADRIESSILYAGLAADDGFLISHLVGVSLQQQSEAMLLRILHEHPDLLTDAQLIGIAHRLTSVAQRTQQVDTRIERTMILDVLQRCFTDDGNGDGRLTASGFDLLGSEIFQLGPESNLDFTLDGSVKPTAIGRLLGPAALVTVASRREHIEAYDHLVGFMDAALQSNTPAARSAELLAELDTEFTKVVDQSHRFPILGILMPSMGSVVQTVHIARAHTGATLLTVAAHLHHRRTGNWPDDASELVPHLLPSIPEDPFDPGRSFRLLVRDGRLLVYSVGSDGDDDSGTIKPNEFGFINTRGVRNLSDRYPHDSVTPDPIKDGDWIIYPTEG
ncbi:MAG: hypothetical protein AAGA55_04025 [Planctomycetota bacterium]